jgi:hypothetical protein
MIPLCSSQPRFNRITPAFSQKAIITLHPVAPNFSSKEDFIKYNLLVIRLRASLKNNSDAKKLPITCFAP